MTTAPRLVVLGRQGAGKGTQCVRLAEHLGVAHVSTGELFRAAARAGTPVGSAVAAHLGRGELVPDDVTVSAVEERLARLGAGGYLLDGFPRTVAQAEAFLADRTERIDAVIELVVPVDTVVDRIARRRTCPACGWTTTVDDPTRAVVTCRGCGALASQRSDDHDDAVRRRLALYDSQTGPLAPWFALQERLVEVDGDDHPDVVFDRICAALDARLGCAPAPLG